MPEPTKNVPLASVAPAAPAAPAVPAPAPAAPAAGPEARISPLLRPDPKPAPAPAKPVEPAKPETFRVRFNHEDMELSPEEARKYAQRGMLADKLDEERRQLAAEREAQRDRIAAAQKLEELARYHPERFQRMMAAANGIEPAPAAPAAGDDDDLGGDPLTPRTPTPSVDPRYEARLARLEAAQHQERESRHQREEDASIGEALGRHGLRDGSEAERMARALVREHMAEGADAEKAAKLAATDIDRLFSARLEREKAAREANRDAALVRSAPEAPAFPRLGRDVANYANHRSGKGREAVRGWLGDIRRALSGPNPNP